MVKTDTMQYDKDTKTMVPLIEYRAPDVDEITGIDPDEEKPSEPPAAEQHAEATPPTSPTEVAKPAEPAVSAADQKLRDDCAAKAPKNLEMSTRHQWVDDCVAKAKATPAKGGTPTAPAKPATTPPAKK